MIRTTEHEPLFQQLQNLPEPGDKARLALTIGVFDGVHRGHQALLADAARVAQLVSGLEDSRVLPAALTFDPHPAAVFSPSRVPPLLGTVTERAALLKGYGAERVIVAPFDRAFAAMTPEEFVRDILWERLHVRAVIVGEDFRFGCDRTGDIAALRHAGERYGFLVSVVPPVFVHGVPARSTSIRHLLLGGQVEEAARLLGRTYTLRGEVVQGRQLGRTLGYPTANLALTPGILVPASGVYAGYVQRGTNHSRHRAAISIGDNPTIAPGLPRTVEAFLMDGFSADLYGEPITVAFAAHLRPMEKFDGLEALIAQMNKDVERAAQLLPIP